MEASNGADYESRSNLGIQESSLDIPLPKIIRYTFAENIIFH